MTAWAGRGHGPGGRLVPMKGDVVEVSVDGGPWTLFEIEGVALGGQAFRAKASHAWWHILLSMLQYEPTGYRGPHPVWRWPHLTTLGLKGSFCCDEHGLIPLELTEPAPIPHGRTGEER